MVKHFSIRSKGGVESPGVSSFWAAAPKESMTYAFTHMGNFLLHLLLLYPSPPLPNYANYAKICQVLQNLTKLCQILPISTKFGQIRQPPWFLRGGAGGENLSYA